MRLRRFGGWVLVGAVAAGIWAYAGSGREEAVAGGGATPVLRRVRLVNATNRTLQSVTLWVKRGEPVAEVPLTQPAIASVSPQGVAVSDRPVATPFSTDVRNVKARIVMEGGAVAFDQYITGDLAYGQTIEEVHLVVSTSPTDPSKFNTRATVFYGNDSAAALQNTGTLTQNQP